MALSRWLLRPVTARDHIIGYLIAMALFLCVIVLMNMTLNVTEFVNLMFTLVGIFALSSLYLRPLVGLLQK